MLPSILAGAGVAFLPHAHPAFPWIQMSILDLVWLNECVRGEISDWQAQKGFSIGKSKFLTNESKQFEVEKEQGRKSLAKLSHDASLMDLKTSAWASYLEAPGFTQQEARGEGKGTYTLISSAGHLL